MRYEELIPTTRYIVIQGSKCGTFQKGDHIQILEDGSLLSREAQGWIEKAEILSLVKEVFFEMDLDWVGKRLDTLQNEINNLNNQILYGKRAYR